MSLFILFNGVTLELNVCIDGFIKENLLSRTNTIVIFMGTLFLVKKTGSLFTSIINRSLNGLS